MVCARRSCIQSCDDTVLYVEACGATVLEMVSRPNTARVWYEPRITVAGSVQANASSEERAKEGKEVVWKRDTEKLKDHESFRTFVSRGGELTWKKCRDKFIRLLDVARDKDKKAIWESGVRDDSWGPDLINEVDLALATEDDVREQRQAAAQGKLIVAQRQQRQEETVR